MNTNLLAVLLVAGGFMLLVSGLLIPVLIAGFVYALLRAPVHIPGPGTQEHGSGDPKREPFRNRPRTVPPSATFEPGEVEAAEVVALDGLVPVGFEPCPEHGAPGWWSRLEDGSVHRKVCSACEKG